MFDDADIDQFDMFDDFNFEGNNTFNVTDIDPDYFEDPVDVLNYDFIDFLDVL